MILLSRIIESISSLEFVGDKSQEISNIVSLKDLGSDDSLLSWCSLKNENLLSTISSGTIICHVETSKDLFNSNCNYILVENPRFVFKYVLESFFYTNTVEYTIEKSAVIHPNSRIAENVKIGHNVVIEEGVEIGSNSEINHNSVILKNSKLGSYVKVGCNCTIGGAGFGYEKNEFGNNEFIPHIGNVVLEDFVEIGNNNTIDRAVMGSTLLKKHVKTDNQVHIGHGVVIGENTLLTANVTFSGSVTVGENVWAAPSTTFINKINVGDNAYTGLGAVVIKDVPDNAVIVGNPGRVLKIKS
jgi:UDP-3-O-[3-hydroxymyristoyl] glucosamine N-acyltransferase